jgi:MoxR-like ATPase
MSAEQERDPTKAFCSVEAVQNALLRENYVTERPLAMTIMLAAQLGKPILLEGEAGVGKTEVAKVVARILGSDLIRLQCYEGLDAQSTIYEWNYAKQILAIRMAESGPDRRSIETAIFSDEFLLPRPLLRAIRYQGPGHAVLLIDEIDRADEEFEAFLLEVLSDFQVTVPELGTFEAKNRPFVVLTSNRTRELNDALKRRCLYLWIEYPTLNKEREIVARKVPGIESKLAEQICGIVHALREIEFYKRPGVAETLDGARALGVLKVDRIDPVLLEETAGCLLKFKDDIERLRSTGAAQIMTKLTERTAS